MRRLLVIEDGTEYGEFARLFLSDAWDIEVARSAAEALDRLARSGFDALLVDLRFDRAPRDALVGDLDGTARRLFAGDEGRALRHLHEHRPVRVACESILQCGFVAW